MPKHYNSLEFLPIWNFKKIQQFSDFRYMLKLDDYSSLPEITLAHIQQMGELWDKFDTEYLEEVGLSKDHLKYLKKKKHLLELELSYVFGDNPSMESVYEVEKMQFDALYPEATASVKFNDELTALEMFFKINIDEKICSTVKYYSYIKKMREHIERAQLQQMTSN